MKCVCAQGRWLGMESAYARSAMPCAVRRTYSTAFGQHDMPAHRIFIFPPTPSSGYTPRPSAILLSPRILRLNYQLACAQRQAQLTVCSASDGTLLAVVVSVANPVPCTRFTLMLTVKDSKKSTRSIIRGIDADLSVLIQHNFVLSLRVAA